MPKQDHLAYVSPGFREFLAINRKMSNVTPQGVRDMVAASETVARAISDMQKAGVAGPRWMRRHGLGFLSSRRAGPDGPRRHAGRRGLTDGDHQPGSVLRA